MIDNRVDSSTVTIEVDDIENDFIETDNIENLIDSFLSPQIHNTSMYSDNRGKHTRIVVENGDQLQSLQSHPIS